MLEARCSRCGETFIPADEADLVHAQTLAGTECGGDGVILVEYLRQQREAAGRERDLRTRWV